MSKFMSIIISPRSNGAVPKRMRTFPGWFASIILACFLTPIPASADRATIREVILHSRGLVVPIHLDANPSGTAAVIRIDHFSADHQRKGFFRIGLLPLLVADGVVFEFRDPASIAECLAGSRSRLEQWFGGRLLELRRVEFRFPTGGNQRLEARRVSFAADGHWELSGGVKWRAATDECEAASGHLQIFGNQAGQLVMEPISGPKLFSLFQR